MSQYIFHRKSYAGTGDVQFSGWIPFNTVEVAVGAGSWDSADRFIVPVAGYYFVAFSCYSNQPGEGRIAVALLNSSNSLVQMDMSNQNYTTSKSTIFKCAANDRLVAGAYSSSFPIRFYAASGHNSFTIMKIM